MPINYTSYVSQISNLLVIGSTTPEFQIMLPGMIDYAEQRIYREVNFLYTQVTDASAAVSSGNRMFTVPTSIGTFITVDNINIITPSTALSSNGTRVQLTPVSREVIDITYPSGQTATGVPEFWAMASNTQAIFGPSPDAPYLVEVVGIQRPTPLTSANSSTFITQYVPDLFIAASMVFGSGYQRDFAAQGDNPQMGAAWEAQYQKLFQSANMEQARAKYEADGWTSNEPSPVQTSKRS
jgi:hypothetical protein